MSLNTDTNKDFKSIHAINRETVHKICSGQVVLNLAIAVKELVENAIDAGATSIEIRLKEYGSELVEVSDNGSGVEEQNFSALTLKHFTSKLKEFSDLESVSTLGFRGEALSSLCALSNLSISTRHKSVECGSKIEYNADGHIKSKIPFARQTGTTVSLANLFSSLPVRHKEFIKNLKREFHKMCQLLYAYCLIAEGVRILCTNQTKKGAKTTVISTQGAKTTKENIICIFGIKQLESLIEVKLNEPDEHILKEFCLEKPTEIPFTFHGYISKCSHGSGRSSSDRQFYYINSRPCEPTKIMKLVNTTYKYFNGNQYPFIFLNIKTSQSQIDVNVTPDKRQIFLEQEKLLLATLKTSLLEMFKEFPSTFKMQNLDLTLGKSQENKNTLSQTLKEWSKTTEKILSDTNRGVKRTVESTKPKGIMGFIYEKRMKIEEDTREDLSEVSTSEDEDKQVEKFVAESYNSSDSEPEMSNLRTNRKKSDLDQELQSSIKEFKKDYKSFKTNLINETTDTNKIEEEQEFKNDFGCYKITIESPRIKTIVTEAKIKNKSETMEMKTNEDIKTIESSKTKTVVTESTKITDEPEIIELKTNEDIRTIETKNLNFSQSSFKSQNNEIIDVSISDIKSIIDKMKVKSELSQSTQVKFRSELTSKDAESELERHISKDMFEKMEIVGQFNKGFIITKLKSDIFIIDQHATDEKYNFETLQKTTTLQNQKLVCPKPLELTAANELLLIDNLEVFHKNGFTFNIDENAEPRHKVSLTAMPVSKNWEFGKEAIDELLFMLQEDSSTTNYRPSGVRAMFASRACRKSVMIGTDLSVSDMRKLISHMGQIDHPWNCPHGRPTMRHLINLNLIKVDNSEEEDE